MVKLSQNTINLLKDDIVNILYENSLKPLFTNEVAFIMRRDNEFTKKLLMELKNLGIVEEIKFNTRKRNYLLRKKWRISNNVLKKYEEMNNVVPFRTKIAPDSSY